MPLRIPLPIISFQDIITRELPTVDWLVTGLIGNQDRVVMYGEFGSYKSWLLLDLALAIASAQPWLGQFGVPRPKKVLYVDEEMNERILRRRIKQLSVGVSARNQNTQFKAMSLGGFTASSAGDVQALIQELQRTDFDPDVIILETLRRVMVGSELDAQPVAAFWSYLRPLQDLGKTVIISHHMRKPSMQGGSDVRHRASGSTDILGGADTAFAITRTDRSRVVLEWVKSRNAEEPQNFAASILNGDSEARRWQFDRFEEHQAQSATAVRQAFDLIIQFLTETEPGGGRPGVIQSYVISQGVQRRTAERAWKQVKVSGRVEKVRALWRLRQEDVPQPTVTSPPTANLYMSGGGGAFSAPTTQTACMTESATLAGDSL